MVQIILTDKDYNEGNLDYIRFTLSELLEQAECRTGIARAGGRSALSVECPAYYADIVKRELCDKTADVIAVNYKYDYFKRRIPTGGLGGIEKELLMTSLIAADLEEDKRYTYGRLKGFGDIAIDGIFHFRLRPLKAKWQGIVNCIPEYFRGSQLKDFITYLLEDKKRKVFVEDEKVYDAQYRRLTRGELMDKGMEEGRIVREVLLSGCGEVEVHSPLPATDEKYLKEYFGDKIILGRGYFS